MYVQSINENRRFQCKWPGNASQGRLGKNSVTSQKKLSEKENVPLRS